MGCTLIVSLTPPPILIIYDVAQPELKCCHACSACVLLRLCFRLLANVCVGGLVVVVVAVDVAVGVVVVVVVVAVVVAVCVCVCVC